MLGADAGKRGSVCEGRSALFCSSSLKPGTALKNKAHEEAGVTGILYFRDGHTSLIIQKPMPSTTTTSLLSAGASGAAAAEWHRLLCRHRHRFQRPREANTGRAVLGDSVASSVNSATGASGCCSPQPRWTLPWAPPHQGVGLLSLRAGLPGRRCPPAGILMKGQSVLQENKDQVFKFLHQIPLRKQICTK